VRRAAPRNQRARAAAPTFLAHRVGRGLREPWIGRQAKVVVRPKVDHAPAAKFNLHALSTRSLAQAAAQAERVERGEFVVDPMQRVVHHGNVS
jgi:hypothetical protein